MNFQDYQKLYEALIKYNRELVDETLLTREILEWKLPNLVSVLPKCLQLRSVAEVGCFTGTLVAHFLPHQEELTRYGYDCNSKAITKGRNIHPNVTFFCEDILTSEIRQYDLVILSDIVEHIQDDVGFLRHLRKLTNNVLLNLPLEKSWSTIGRKYGMQDPSGHLRAYSLKDAVHLCSTSGFTISNYEIKWFCETEFYKEKKIGGNFLKKGLWKVVMSNQLLRRRYFASNLFAFLTTT